MKAKFLPLACLSVLTCCLAATLSAATPKIGVLLKGKTPFWAAMEKGALRAGETLGAEVVVKSPLTEADIAVQIQLLNALAAQGMDVIVLAANSKDSLVEPVAALRSKGTKVVLIDSMLNGPDVPVFVGTDQGAEAQRAAYLLQQFPKVKAVLTSSTPGTLAMLRTLKEKNLAGSIKLVGFGFNLNAEVAAALEAGEMHGWVAQLPGEIGFQGVKTALALLKGESLPPVVNTEFILITKENLHTPRVQALLPQP